jgi:hypothetical protein
MADHWLGVDGIDWFRDCGSVSLRAYVRYCHSIGGSENKAFCFGVGYAGLGPGAGEGRLRICWRRHCKIELPSSTAVLKHCIVIEEFLLGKFLDRRVLLNIPFASPKPSR